MKNRISEILQHHEVELQIDPAEDTGWDLSETGYRVPSKVNPVLRGLDHWLSSDPERDTHNQLSELAGQIERLLQDHLKESATPVFQRPEVIEHIFHRLVADWMQKRPPSSNVRDLCMCSSYQKIIGLGPVAVSMIISELTRRLDHWFWALAAITRCNPVQPEHNGNLEAMRADWLTWWQGHRHEWTNSTH